MTVVPMPSPGDADTPIPRAPRGIRPDGRRLWRNVLADYDLDGQGMELLAQACRTVDRIADLDAATASEGVMGESSQGARVHPAIVEARQQRGVLTHLIGALGLDFDDTDEAPTPGPSPRSVQARAAARARWSPRATA